MAADPVQFEENRVMRRIYLGRYGRQSWDVIDTMDVPSLRAHTRCLMDLIKGEPGKPGEQDYV